MTQQAINTGTAPNDGTGETLRSFGQKQDAMNTELYTSVAARIPTSYLDTDGTLAANSDVKIASQKAMVTYVAARIAALVAASPAALDTLNELAAALGNDANFAATIATALAGKQPLDADLTALAGLASAANKLGYFTGAGAMALTDFVPQSTAFTPVWKGSGSDPALGNGTLTGKYTRFGSFMRFKIDLVIGSTTTFGTGYWYFQPPLGLTFDGESHGNLRVLDSGVAVYQGNWYTIPGQIAMLVSNALIGPTVPFTFGSADELHLSGTLLTT